MVVHTCIRCEKDFNKKSDYDRHIGRKFKCKIRNPPPPTPPPEPVSEPINIPDNTALINTLIQENNTFKVQLKSCYTEMNELKKMLMELQRTSQINSNNVNIGNTTNNNTINIISFNNDHNMAQVFLKDEIIKLLKSNDCVKEAIQLMYFNDRIPQYKNIDVKANE